ncbi:hypothetical protein CI102_9074 [Trichoderma harzianum]|nr:hypothetical protein CI102_9074 [Trichoderma harzianum]
MPQAQAQMVMCKHAHPADVEGKISTADGMQRRSTVVWEITNSSSASSTTYATQSRVDIGQKGGGSKEGLAKGLGWRSANKETKAEQAHDNGEMADRRGGLEYKENRRLNVATAYGDCDAEAVASTGLTAVVPDSGVVPATAAAPQSICTRTCTNASTACRTVIGESRTGLVPRSQTPGGSGTGLTGEDTGTEMNTQKDATSPRKKSPQRCEEDANSSLCVPMTEAKRHQWPKSLAYRVRFQYFLVFEVAAMRHPSANVNLSKPKKKTSNHSSPAHKCDRKREIEAGSQITASRR